MTEQQLREMCDFFELKMAAEARGRYRLSNWLTSKTCTLNTAEKLVYKMGAVCGGDGGETISAPHPGRRAKGYIVWARGRRA